MLVPGVIIPWTGTHASIPSGWVRETDLDSRYPKGQGAQSPGTNGGSTTHQHSSPTHSHTLGGHTHTYTMSDGFGTPDTSPGAASALACEHNHGTSTSGTSSGGTTSSDVVTYSSVSNDPPYYGVIFIRSAAYNFIPVNASVLWDSASIPSGLSFHDGAAATPDLRNKYLRGASAGSDTGETGGSSTNVHDISHSHTANTHTHVSAASNTSTDFCGRGSSAGPPFNAMSTAGHTHNVTLGTGTQAINSFSGTLTTAETVEPAYRKILCVKNTSGSPKLPPKGTIALWKGATSTIPVGWSLYTSQNSKYLKIANTTGEIGDTGGSNTHSHAAKSHSHTSPSSHDHLAGTISDHVGIIDVAGGGANYDSPFVQHTMTGITSTTATYTSANTTADAATNEPLHTAVCYIKMDFPTGGGALAILL